jgi:hypothetical protein
MSVTINGSSGLTFNDASTQNTAATGFGFKNRIINGAMMIDQRNAGASVSVPSGQPKYPIDRFYCDSASGSGAVYSAQQSSVAPIGFTNSLLVTVTTAATVNSGDYQYIRQQIEGYNFSDLMSGTANAGVFTLSFWVRSSVTGTFGGYLGAAANNRFRVFSYTINAANTWEYKTVTIQADTSGTWDTTNGVGLQVAWSLACGTTYQGATGSWSSSLLLGVTGQVNLTTTSGATFYITGVQLEKGSTATSFDYRPYGTELALCQRYYEILGLVLVTTATGVYPQANFRVNKRTSPTLTLTFASGSGATLSGYIDPTTGFYQSTNHTVNIQSTVTASAEL